VALLVRSHLRVVYIEPSIPVKRGVDFVQVDPADARPKPVGLEPSVGDHRFDGALVDGQVLSGLGDGGPAATDVRVGQRERAFPRVGAADARRLPFRRRTLSENWCVAAGTGWYWPIAAQ
jgi:hypothetical protein